jgi:fibronectin type 3 domain-containing protein
LEKTLLDNKENMNNLLDKKIKQTENSYAEVITMIKAEKIELIDKNEIAMNDLKDHYKNNEETIKNTYEKKIER